MGVILMEKIKIHELAKKLNLNSKDILEKASSLGIDAKSHLSSITEEEAKKIEKAMGKNMEKEKNNQVKNEKKKEKVSDQPVIIRREVIINDQDEKKNEIKKKDTRKNDIGFVEKNRNKDYNIVYREKTKKPMSVAEFFGIPQKNKDTKQKTENIGEKKAEPTAGEVKKIEVQEKAEVKEVNQDKKVEETSKNDNSNINANTNSSNNTRSRNNNTNNNYHNNNSNYQNRNNKNNNFQNRK